MKLRFVKYRESSNIRESPFTSFLIREDSHFNISEDFRISGNPLYLMYEIRRTCFRVVTQFYILHFKTSTDE